MKPTYCLECKKRVYVSHYVTMRNKRLEIICKICALRLAEEEVEIFIIGECPY